jgi:hypothetical protein
MSRRLISALVLLFATAVAGCDQDSPSPSSPPPPSGSGDTITGRERSGWTQTSAGGGDPSSLQYAAYVDGNRRVLQEVTCAPASEGVDCSAPLPSLTAGRHTIELASFFMGSDGATIEGPRSAPLQVQVAGVVTGAAGGSTVNGGSLIASDGQKLQADVITDGLVDPVDVAIDSRGRAFVVERAGTLRIVSATAAAGRMRGEPLFGSRDEGSRALSVALASDFATSRFVYALGAQPSSNGSRFFVTRYRELNGTLGQAAVIYTQELPGTEPHGVLRFGPDAAMYVAASATPESPAQILRLQADGRIPPDNPDASPVYSRVDLMPAGLAWQPSELALWTAQTGDAIDRLAVLRRMRTATAAPNDPGLVTMVAASDLPAGTRVSGLAIVGAEASPFYRAVVVSSMGLADLLVFTGRDGDSGDGATRLLQGQFGAIGGVTAAPTGDLYFFTANSQTWGAGSDVLVRLRRSQ